MGLQMRVVDMKSLKWYLIILIVAFMVAAVSAQGAIEGLSTFGVNSTGVHLVWEKSDGSEAHSFLILRNGTEIGERDIEMLGFTDFGLAPSATYLYTVQSYTRDGLYIGESSIEVTTPAEDPDPPAPGNHCDQDCYRKAPYLIYTNDPTSMTIAWQASDDLTGYSVNWGPLDGQVSVSAEDDRRYFATITGLKPRMTYWYNITLNCKSKTGYYGGEFVTAPDATTQEETVTFYGYGDTRAFSYWHAQERVMEQLWNDVVKSKFLRQSILLHAGDYVAYGDYDGHGNIWYNYWDDFFFNAKDNVNTKIVLNNIPILGTLGNHEYTYNDVHFHCDNGGSIFYKYWPLPMYPEAPLYPATENNTEHFYYSFDYGSVHFVSIDSYPSDSCTYGDPPSENYAPYTDQYQWLETDLNESSKPWNVAFLHIPIYHPDHIDTNGIYYLVPLFEKYDIPLVIQGHVHNYARCVIDNRTYLTLGGGGASLDDIKNPLDNGCKVSAKAYHFARFDVTGNWMNVTVIDDQGRTIDQFSIAKTPEGTILPGDLDGDGRTEDLNGNGRADFSDLAMLSYFVRIQPADSNIPEIDFNANGRLDQFDTGALYRVLKAHWYASAQDLLKK
jgi:hypothetical protein